MQAGKKVLIFSVGYGMGHHAAARAVAEELKRRGFCVQCTDPCAASCPRFFAFTRRFYHFCVRRAPWIWGITYEQTDNSDWGGMLWMPGLSACVRLIRATIEEFHPDICLCTYPLFAHMLDAINAGRQQKVPYALVVTDALEISRPWAMTKAPLICVTDSQSRERLIHAYGLAPERIVSTGFPVRAAFNHTAAHKAPTRENLHILYGAFVSPEQVRRDVRGLLSSYRAAKLVLIAGERWRRLQHLLQEFPDRVELHSQVKDMQPFFEKADLYIGKAGAATLFEAYASGVPVVVNYALPGQEQGNLELLLADGAGLHAVGTPALLQATDSLLAAGGALWMNCRNAMLQVERTRGAENIVDEMERRFL